MKDDRDRFRLLLFLVGLALLASMVTFGATLLKAEGAAAVQDAVASVQPVPASAYVNVGETITIAITVTHVADLYGADVRVSFDPALLSVQDADPDRAGVQVAEGIAPLPGFVWNSVDNAAGTIWYMVTQLNPQEPFTGSGAMFTITFLGLAEGTSEVDITDCTLVNRHGEDIAHVVSGGVVHVAHATATPTATPTATATATATFTATPAAPPATATPTATPTCTPGAPPAAEFRIYLPIVYYPGPSPPLYAPKPH